ncbi:MAG: hypothetical protein Q4Q24_02160 [Methanobrevibacter ruminantium]|uniref:hypothetical protein n=1 Tax=Methanobrevibacter ruminantium TaxID=83816 RepID=UPI0026ED3EB7|nr:hypothetical protein [Methanobrevibacter ruminantium]MDO5842061.1 hypothetical protein [Methanobrevibacter ruminantium]
MNKYKSLALLISIIFILSFVSTAISAHPGHGSEYDVEEVTTSEGSSSSGSGSVSHASSSSGGSGSSGSGSVSHASSSSTENPSYSVEEVKTNSSVEEIDDKINNTGSDEITDNNEDESNLFSLSNILLLIGVLICGFLGVIILFKLLSN